jgi:hypothetical protein
MFKEELLCNYWISNIQKFNNLRLVTGEKLKVIHPGSINKDAGPDIDSAHILVDNIEWIGNIEIHINGRDWYSHGHQNDPNYKLIILHVVWQVDPSEIKGIRPTLELSTFLNEKDLYHQSNLKLMCSEKVSKVSDIFFDQYLQELFKLRIEAKVAATKALYVYVNNDYYQTVFALSCRCIGGYVNRDAFEYFGRELNIKRMLRMNKDNLQAYFEMILNGEPSHFKSMLNPLGNEFILKKHRMYPTGRPIKKAKTLRLLVAEFPALIDALNPDKDVVDIWSGLIEFGKRIEITKPQVEKLFINAAIPLILIFNNSSKFEVIYRNILAIMKLLKIEDNIITRNWQKIRYFEKTAVQGQGLIELNNSYCKLGNCLNCQIGQKLFKNDK